MTEFVRPRLLDLFCGAGGCSMGYHQAGFDVVGVDINPQPHYPFEFMRGDAVDALLGLKGGWRAVVTTTGGYYTSFDAIHASPPCQAHTRARKLQGDDHPDLIPPVREALEAIGLPYVIENVPGAPLLDPQVLEGQMFEGLNVHRPRLFETNWPLEVPVLIPPPPRQTKMGRPPVPGEAMQIVGHFSDVPAGREAMGIDWMTQHELAQAIPPAYTEFIGRQLATHLVFGGGRMSTTLPVPPDADQYVPRSGPEGGVCAICGRPPKTRKLHVDHDHKTGKVRGLLCYTCNRFILGRYATPAKLRAAADYLERNAG